MIDIFTDPLFRMELARLASEQVVTRRVTVQNQFQHFMAKLKAVQEQPQEVKSMTGTYIRIPEPVKNTLPELSIKLKETVREGPRDYIVPVDVDRGIWERWDGQKQTWKQFRTEQGVHWNATRQKWERVKSGIAEGRVA